MATATRTPTGKELPKTPMDSLDDNPESAAIPIKPSKSHRKRLWGHNFQTSLAGIPVLLARSYLRRVCGLGQEKAPLTNHRLGHFNRGDGHERIVQIGR